METRFVGFSIFAALVGMAALTSGVAVASPTLSAAPPPVPTRVQGDAGVKAYLMEIIASARKGAADLQVDSRAYAGLCAQAGGAAAAAKAHPQQIADLVLHMRDDYQRIDSYGYEYMEGIVAGVPSLMKYDIELDSGVPAKKAQLTDTVADITIKASDKTIDHEGSLNNFLIEPTVYGTNPRFVSATNVPLPGFAKPANLPDPAVATALADYAVDGYARLDRDATAWKPNDADLFHILANMTPTLADYFDEWKESKKYGSASGGRFVAVSRVSDMRGIMTSTRLAWLAVADEVSRKDPSLSASVSRGYSQVLRFIDTIDAREQRKPLRIEAIDALGQQAKDKADRLTVQASQAAALMGVDVNAK